MKLILIYDFINANTLDFQSKDIVQVSGNSIAKNKIMDWLQNPNIEDKQPLVSILVRNKLTTEQKKEISNLLTETHLNVQQFFIFQLLTDNDKLPEIETSIINNVSQDQFILYPRNEDNLLLKNPDEDRYSIIQNFIEVLHSNYSDYSQAYQNREAGNNYLFTLSSYNCHLQTKDLEKQVEYITESQYYGAFIFLNENNEINNLIIEQIDSNQTIEKDNLLDKIDDLEQKHINQFDDSSSVQKNVNNFFYNTNIINEKNEKSLNLQILEGNLFEDFYSKEKFHAGFNRNQTWIDSIIHKTIISTVEMNSKTDALCEKLENIVSHYRTSNLLEIESELLKNIQDKTSRFEEEKTTFVANCLTNSGKHLHKTTDLEYLLAHLDIALYGQSNYVENFSGDSLNHQYLDKIIVEDEQQTNGQVPFYKVNNAITEFLKKFRTSLRNNNEAIQQNVNDLHLFQSHFKLQTSDCNQYSWWKKSNFAKLSNLSIVVLFSFVISIIGMWLVRYYWEYWTIGLILFWIVFFGVSLNNIFKRKKKIKRLITEREDILARCKTEIKKQFAEINKGLIAKYRKKLLHNYKNILITERYQIVQLRKYFFYHFYKSIKSINKIADNKQDSLFRKNLLSKEDIISLISENIPRINVTSNVTTYLHNFKYNCRKIEKNYFDELNYSGFSLFDDDPFVKINATEDAPENLYYTEIENTHLFKANTKANIGKIDKKDINQGQVGDCYFMAVLAGLAEKQPKFLENSVIFNEKEKFYTVRLYDNETNEIYVNIDGKLYTIDNKEELIYARFNPKQKEDHKMWVAIIEKAWAKVNNKSYEDIIGSNKSRRKHKDYGLALTGNYMSFYNISSFSSYNDLECFLDKVGYFENKAIVTLGSISQVNKGISSPELVTSHAYTLSKMDKVTRKMNIYNPHGENHFSNIDFDFLKNNFDCLFCFTLSENTAIKPTNKLDETQDIPEIKISINTKIKKSPLNSELIRLNFYEYFWTSLSDAEKTNKIKGINNILGTFYPDAKNVLTDTSFVILPNYSIENSTTKEIQNLLDKNLSGSKNYITSSNSNTMTCVRIKSIKQ